MKFPVKHMSKCVLVIHRILVCSENSGPFEFLATRTDQSDEARSVRVTSYVDDGAIRRNVPDRIEIINSLKL